VAATQDAHLEGRSPLRERGHPYEVETTKTAGLGETTFPWRLIEEVTERLSTL